MKKILPINLLLCFSIFSAEYKTIDTPNVKVVFEEGLEEQAEKVTNNINKLKSYYDKNNENLLEKIPIILKKNDPRSNAYFITGPKRIKMIATPMLDIGLGTTPWLTDLSIHEYRHYYQYEAINNNFNSKLGYIFCGELGQVIYSHFIFPNWFWEGDAVYYETKLSNNGRGRNPNFLKDYRALLAEGKEYSYEKAKNGSYKDYIPNHYYLGYMLVSYGYEKYGENFWEDVMANIGKSWKDRYKWTYMSNVIESKTGLNTKEFYNEAMKYFKEKYKVEKTIDYKQVNKKVKVPTNYCYAYETNEGIITLKKSYDEITALYKINDNGEEKLFTFGNMTSSYFQSKNNKVIWSEIEPDLINAKKAYSNIKLYDIKKQIKIDLTNKSQYFMPSLSKSCKYIAAIKNTADESAKINILDINGNFIKEIRNDSNYLYNSIDWIDDKNIIVSLRNEKGQMGIITINTETFEEKEILPFKDYIIGNLNIVDNNVYFTGSFGLVENVYRINLDDKKIYKVTSSNIGTQGGTVIDGKLYFSEFSANGYNLKESENILGEKTEVKSLLEVKELNPSNFKNKKLNLLEEKEEKSYSIEDYNYMMNMIDVHSWLVSSVDGAFVFDIMSSNELEDFNSSLRYENKVIDDEYVQEKVILTGSSTRYWPNLSLKYEKEWGDIRHTDSLNLGMAFPFDFSKNEYNKTAKIGLHYIDYFNEKDNQYLIEGNVNRIKYGAYKDIISENSQSVDFSYRVDSNGNSKSNLDLTLTTKGLFKNDGIKYEFVYENDRGNLEYSDDEVISRGYKEISYKKAVKNSLDYHVPLYYPDKGALGFYFNRLRTDFFYDNTQLDSNKTYSSVGNKLSVDGKLFTLNNFEISFQYSYLLETKDYKTDFGFQFKL